jgi:RNA-binding protein
MPAPTLTEKHKKHLRGLGHALKVIVAVGDKGLTPTVIAELDGALTAHELVKVRVRLAERSERDAALEQLAGQTGAALVSRIGHVGLYFRPRKEASRIVLPGA